MEIDDFDQVRMKESDEFRALANHCSCGSRRIAEQCHLAEEVPRLKLCKRQGMVCSVVEHNVHATGPDDIDARAGLGFQEHRLFRFVRSNVEDALQNSQ